MKNKAILLSLFITILLSSFVTAQIQIEQYSSDFSINPVNLNPIVCLCSSFNDEIILENNAPFPQVLEISSNYSGASIGVNQITLGPGDEMIIPILLSASCSKDPSIVPYDVTVKSTTGEEKSFRRTLELRECQTIDATLFTNKNSSSICESVDYSLKLRNPSTLTESYLIGPTSDVEFFDVKGYNVTLKPNQVSVLNFTFAPSCDISGNIKNEFRIESLISDLSAIVDHALFIEPGYNFSVAGSEDLSLCRLENTTIQYTITNDGLINNTYDLSIKNNPDFVSLSEETLSLAPNESYDINLYFTPQDRSKDNYQFELIADARIGDVTSTKSIDLNLSDCYAASLSILNPRSLTVCEGEEVIPVSLENLGTKTETYYLVSESSRTTLSMNNVTIEPNAGEVFDLFIDTSDLKGKESFAIQAHSYRNLLTHWSDSITLDIVSSYDCTKLTFPRSSKIYSRFYEDNVSLTVTNTGIEIENYSIEYHGSDFLRLADASAVISPGEDFTVVLDKTREHEQDEYFFSLNFTSASGEQYSKEFKLVLTGTPLFEQISEYANQNPCFIFTLIILVLTFLFLLSLLIFGSIFSKNLRLIVGFALLLLFLFALFIYGLPTRVNPPLVNLDDPYSFSIYQGETLVIDLNDYIVDPDNGNLSFMILDEPSNISLILEDDMLIIDSDNFTGVDRFRVFAEDEAGADVVTPRFNIEVFERVSLSFNEWYERYCVHLNMLLLLVLTIFVFLSGNRDKHVKQASKQSGKQDKTSTKKTVKKSSKKKSSSKKSNKK